MTSSFDLTGKASGGRKLIAVVYADMVGYSRLIALDDLGTLERLRTLRRTLIDPAINEHGGRLVQTGGDSLLIVFDSIDGAVRCAVTIQRQVPKHDGDQPSDRAIRFRVGVNIGDVIADGTDLHGDGVNVAARLQAECPPGDICVARAVRDHVHDRLDLAFDELGPLSLKNISRPVEAFVIRLAPAAPGPAKPSTAGLTDANVKQAKPPRLSVIILPFRKQTFAPEHAYLADEIIEDFTTELSRLPGVLLISPPGSLRYDSDSTSPGDFARDLNVSYSLQGSIRVTPDRIGINLQLIRSESRAHIWAERSDIDRAAATEARDEFTGRLVRIVYMKLLEDVRRHASAPSPQGWTSSDLVMHGRALAYRPLAPENERDAIRCFEQALEMDPTSVDARIGIADVLISEMLHGWSQFDKPAMARIEQLLIDVLRHDADIAEAHTYMGVLRRLQGRLIEARIELEIAIGLRSNNTLALGQLGITLAFLGRPEAAIPLIERCLRLAPNGGITSAAYADLALCKLLLGHIEAALDCLRKARAGNPRLYYIHLLLAAVLGLRGDLDEAGAALNQAVEINPEIHSLASLRALPWHIDPQFIVQFDKTFGAGLKRAGLSEE